MGFLISFEGGEGCGKSTQIKRFSQYLTEKKVDFLRNRSRRKDKTNFA